MAKIGRILEKFWPFSKAQDPVLYDTADEILPYTPFEKILIQAFNSARKARCEALIVRLVPDAEGTMVFYDPAKKGTAKYRYDFSGVANGKNPYDLIDAFTAVGEPVAMAFNAKVQSIPLQYDFWSAGSLKTPASYRARPVICLPPRSDFEQLGVQEAKYNEALTRQQGKPKLRLATVNGSDFSVRYG